MSNILEKGLGVVKLVIVSRLLGPAEFGLYGLALVVIMTIEQLTQVGVESALIQKKEVNRADKDTAWLLMLLRGLSLGGLTWWAAPYLAAFFDQPALTALVQLLAVALVINSLQSIEFFLARRALRFGPWFWVRSSGSVVDFVVSLGLAWLWGNAWALVVGYVCAVTTRTIVGYITAPYRPAFVFERASFVHLLKFGRWAGGLSIVLFLLLQGGDLIIGKALGVTALGLYQLGNRIANMPTSEVTHVLSGLTLPLYARLKNAGEGVAEAFLSIITLTALISIPTAVAIFSFSEAFVSAFLGGEWLPAVPIIQLLAIWGMTRSLDASAGALFFAMGRPDLDFKLHLAKLTLLAVLIVPALHLWGLVGVAGAVVICGLVVSPLTVVAAMRIIGCPASQFLKALAVPVLIGTLIGLPFLAILELALSPLLTLGLGVLTFAAIGALVGLQLRQGRIANTTSLLRAFGSGA